MSLENFFVCLSFFHSLSVSLSLLTRNSKDAIGRKETVGININPYLANVENMMSS